MREFGTISSLLVIFLSILPPTNALGSNRLGNINVLFAKEKHLRKLRLGGVNNAFSKPGENSTDDNWVTTANFIEIPLDHNGTVSDTFRNHYWTYERFYTPGGPIFIVDIGESAAEDTANDWLTSAPVVNLLEKFGGLGVVWEHRYYGQSVPARAYGYTPGSIDDNTPTGDFRFLTNDQALADVMYFAERFNSSKHPDHDATASGSPWIMIGGSYSGIRASLMREKYPDTIFAAYVSSAPIEAQVEMPEYYDHIAQSLIEENPTCVKNFQSAINYIDIELSKGGESAETVKKLFLGLGSEHNTNGDFADFLATPFDFYQTAGYSGLLTNDSEGYSVATMCQWVNTDDMNTASPIEGWEKGGNRTAEWIATRLAEWKGWIALLNFSSAVDCGGYRYKDEVYSSHTGCNLAYNSRTHPSDDIAWQWQTCTEWGFWQVANIGPKQIVSKYYDASVFQERCHLQFFDNMTPDRLPNLPSVDQTNHVYGGWLRAQTRTFYTWNELDPWTPLTIFSNDTNAPKNTAIDEIPDCESLPSGNKVFGWYQPGGTHCEDLSGNPDSAGSLDLLQRALETWLPCFTPRDAKNNQTSDDGNGFTPDKGKHPGGQLPGPKPDPVRFNLTAVHHAFNASAVEEGLLKAKSGLNHTNERVGKLTVRWMG
ncbi:hypothetical protein TWF694_011489 [Orbilia ellipsospora]|uniref:Uncharacterized protein n=1 Tax=Orbilia ellipsospora TaxID=2528407 RepID=A0AAV9X6I7_9PEZI